MSHYAKLSVNFTNAAILKKALEACGIPANQIAVGAPTVPYETYIGTPAGQCHVKVKRDYLGSGCNDVAFTLNPEGKSEMKLCDYAERRLGGDFRQKIVREYAVAATVSHYEEQGKTVYRKQGEKGRIHLFTSV